MTLGVMGSAEFALKVRSIDILLADWLIDFSAYVGSS